MKPLKTIDIQDLADTKYICEIKFDEEQTHCSHNALSGTCTLTHGHRREDVHFELIFEFMIIIDKETGLLEHFEYSRLLHRAELTYNESKIEFYDYERKVKVEDITEYENILIETVEASNFLEELEKLDLLNRLEYFTMIEESND
jgi:hypothetical protein